MICSHSACASIIAFRAACTRDQSLKIINLQLGHPAVNYGDRAPASAERPLPLSACAIGASFPCGSHTPAADGSQAYIRILLQKETTKGLDPRPGFFPPPSADGACPLPRSAKHLQVYRASSWSLYLDLLKVHIGFLRLLLGLESGNQHTSAYNRALHARPV